MGQGGLLSRPVLFLTAPIYYEFKIFLIWSGIVSICAAAWALYHAGVPLLPIIVLLETVLTASSHALPFGPLGSACFFIVTLWIELV
jgi:hypothetical protein